MGRASTWALPLNVAGGGVEDAAPGLIAHQTLSSFLRLAVADAMHCTQRRVSAGDAPWLARPDAPTPDDRAAWSACWQAQGMPWRTAPESDAARQQYLTAHQAILPDTAHGRFPCRDERGSICLSRADVEWLLARHMRAGQTGPVNRADPRQHARTGLDQRRAVLRGTDLHHLPLAGLRGGPTGAVWR